MLATAKKDDTIFGKEAKAEASIGRFIPYSRMVDEETIKTKEGFFLKIIKIEGMAFETADEIDINQRKNVRATLLRGISNSRFALYHHIIRREENSEQGGFFENDFCRELDNAYQARLASKRMFVNEQYITIVRRPAQGAFGLMADFGRTLFTRIDRQILKNQETEDIKALNEAARHLLTTLSPYRPRILGFKKTGQSVFAENLSFLSYLVNWEKTEIRPPCMGIADYLPSKRLSFGKEAFEVRGSAPGDVKLGAILSLKEYADGTGPGMLDSLLRLPHEFILTQSFGFVDRQASLNAMRDTKRKLIAGEQGATSLEEDLDNAIDDLASGRSTFGEHHLTITAIGKNTAALNSVISDCVSAFVNLGIVTTREDINLEPTYWAQLPGNFSFIARRSLISNSNFAGFASLHNFPAGKALGNHWGPAITRLETTSGTPYWFNFHERDVGNFTVIGPTGFGKTVLLTFLNAQAQRLKPRTVYFDKDHGAEIYLRAIGGNYTTVRQGLPTGMNPLQLPDTPENRAFIREWIRLLITLDNHTPVSPQDLEIIADAVNASFEEPLHHRRLRFFAELLSGHEISHGSSLSARMAKWHSGGERAWLFDHEQDTLALDNRNIGFDLTSIPSDIAGLLIAAAADNIGSGASDENSANQALSTFFNRGMTVSSKLLEGAGWNDFGQYLYAGLVWFGTIGLTGYSTMLIVLSKLAVAILLAVGPVFILLLVFMNTKGLFEGWLRTLLNYAIIPIFVYALLALLLMLIEQPLTILEQNSNTNSNLLSYIGPFLLTAIVSMLLLSQILNMAASITGGVSLSTMGTGAWASRKIAAPVKGASAWSWNKIKNRSPRGGKVRNSKESFGTLIQKTNEI